MLNYRKRKVDDYKLCRVNKLEGREQEIALGRENWLAYAKPSSALSRAITTLLSLVCSFLCFSSSSIHLPSSTSFIFTPFSSRFLLAYRIAFFHCRIHRLSQVISSSRQISDRPRSFQAIIARDWCQQSRTFITQSDTFFFATNSSSWKTAGRVLQVKVIPVWAQATEPPPRNLLCITLAHCRRKRAGYALSF